MIKNNQIQLVLNRDIVSELKKTVKIAYPNEACGFIFGKVSEVKNKFDHFCIYRFKAISFQRLESRNKSPVKFLINDVEKVFQILNDITLNNNLQLISIFHSHPRSDVPSKFDIDYMIFLDKSKIKTYKNQIWTIMSATTKNIRGYLYFNNKFYEISIIVKL